MKNLLTSTVAQLETRKEQALINEVKTLADNFEEGIKRTDIFKDALKIHGITVDAERALGFSPQRILQIARENIIWAEQTIANAEKYGKRHHIREAVGEIPERLAVQKRILKAVQGSLDEFHRSLEEIYGAEAERAWAEAQAQREAQIELLQQIRQTPKRKHSAHSVHQ